MMIQNVLHRLNGQRSNMIVVLVRYGPAQGHMTQRLLRWMVYIYFSIHDLYSRLFLHSNQSYFSMVFLTVLLMLLFTDPCAGTHELKFSTKLV